jgi:hypothetical protein
MFTKPISRRTLLKGLGTAIALPWLEAMAPLSLATSRREAPKRLAFFYVPNGVNMAEWTPKAEGKDFELHGILEPLKPFKDHLSVLSGLTCDKARANGDGPGDHARAMAAFLTGKQAKKTDGADIRAGISIDQLAAQKLGDATKFPSLELGCEGGRQAGNCDSGYSCAYSSNLSWRGEASPMIKEIDPRLVFERLFGNGPKDEADASKAKRERYQKSILDFVMDDAQSLQSKLGGNDRRKLDEYLTAVRDIERRISRSEKVNVTAGDTPLTVVKPTGIPREYADHIQLLAELLALAFQTDLTRVATFVFANEGSNRSYRFMDVPEGHHDLSHHGRNAEKLEKIKKINLFHMNGFAYLLEKLKSTREGDGNLLDNCTLVYGSGNGDGNRHNHDDLPILLAGKGGGAIKTNRHVRYAKNTPICNLYLSLLDILGVKEETFGDSNGRLSDLT